MTTAASKPPKTVNKRDLKKCVRKSILQSVYAYFDLYGLDLETGYHDIEWIAQKVKEDTAYNRYHWAWYRKKWKERRDDLSAREELKKIR